MKEHIVIEKQIDNPIKAGETYQFTEYPDEKSPIKSKQFVNDERPLNTQGKFQIPEFPPEQTKLWSPLPMWK